MHENLTCEYSYGTHSLIHICTYAGIIWVVLAHSQQSVQSIPYVGSLDSVQARPETAFWWTGAAKRLAGKTDSLTIKPQAESALRLGLRREQDKVHKLNLYDTKCVHWFWLCRGTLMNYTNSTVRYTNLLPMWETIVGEKKESTHSTQGPKNLWVAVHKSMKTNTMLIRLEIPEMFRFEFRSFFFYDPGLQKVLQICWIPKVTIRPNLMWFWPCIVVNMWK